MWTSNSFLRRKIMPKITVTSAKGLYQETGTTHPLTLDSSNTVMKIATVDNTAAFVQNADSIVSWTQPANTFIDSIDLLCTVAPVTASGASLGYEVGSTSSGVEIVANQVDEIIDAGTDGTDLAVGGLVRTAMVRITTDDVTLAVDASYTAASRTVYLNTVCTNHAVTTAGTMRWIIKYISFAA
jgi:uncharacterized membrane-anchored protein YitT (DUF2179 family)